MGWSTSDAIGMLTSLRLGACHTGLARSITGARLDIIPVHTQEVAPQAGLGPGHSHQKARCEVPPTEDRPPYY